MDAILLERAREAQRIPAHPLRHARCCEMMDAAYDLSAIVDPPDDTPAAELIEQSNFGRSVT